MELTVYRQASKERPDGTVVYKGEDALPFVNDNVLFVADGLGGAAAIRHQNIDPGLFDPEKLPEILFGELCGGELPQDFARYIRDSFFELYAVRDCYTENINNIKKSGYFASRIVAGILLHLFLYNEPPFEAAEWIRSLAGMPEDEREARLKQAGTAFAGEVTGGLKRIAEWGKLTYESAYAGLALLGTTVCMTLFRESDDEVQAVYLTAGDSRPYFWGEEEGLCQLLPDEEGADGGMTNYIRANEDAEVRIRCSYFSFGKPCILFNASDGCFDSKYFLSPMAFEKLLLETACASASPAQMGEKLTETFKEYGRHDDSSTIAMKMFGFADFEEVKKSAARRLDALHRDYLDKLPELLERDYDQEPEGLDPETDVLRSNLQKALFENYDHAYRSLMLPEEIPGAEEPVGAEEAQEKVTTVPLPGLNLQSLKSPGKGIPGSEEWLKEHAAELERELRASKEHPDWDLPPDLTHPVIPEQPRDMDIPPSEWRKLHERFNRPWRPGGRKG
ncbi:MAG: hypothetical protein K6G16_08690 [Lachnospiraceae bacterium]|nr:hypothetical protein [Lachnospiraceae bacterium]